MKKITVILMTFILSICSSKAQYNTSTCNESARQSCEYSNELAMVYNNYTYHQGVQNVFQAVAECMDMDMDHWTDYIEAFEGISPWQSWENADDCSALAWERGDQLDNDFMEHTLCAEERRDICYNNAGCTVWPDYYSDYPDDYCN